MCAPFGEHDLEFEWFEKNVWQHFSGWDQFMLPIFDLISV